MPNKKINLLFIGDIFGQPGIDMVTKHINNIKEKYKIDAVVAQCENVTKRKGFIKSDYEQLKRCGVDVCTLGNHVWAQEGIFEIINNDDVVRPLNIPNSYAGHGTTIIKLKNGSTLRVTSLMGITFNKLLNPWKHEFADNFFDAIDNVIQYGEKTDFHFIDFHGETTSEKAVLGLYLDGKVDALCGTHTHVQTNDARVLEKGTCFITDAGMVGPYNCAIGANFDEVYQHMRYGAFSKFQVSKNCCQFNAVVMELNTVNKSDNKIQTITILPESNS
ncbi:YmdB family metallophosphoesterase [Mycoplasma sp. ES3157-GEN-MYC]|uniref:YmdB family metallophosphoesterase n=1 Tax=Mycoplasma miroungigenitalium TaxID=754515 RepID=A0A6M4JB39_9MOLU|nr:TIGR00282 family metallophosphoesterase [Mycoplasma miroungigenitalium]MBU4690182.1 YmdB family metallophosphoesterase [Mycoplasma miroungigenitalium]MBU4691453.1 YmdB family metallophosphoesterase [Mycoplasma miroungigenitalium]QJR43289.1 YmdB family metallophosphoesterase [Mycoplasma miroungigenitalium]